MRGNYELASLPWQERTQGLHGLLFGDPNQARVCPGDAKQVRPPVLLCRQGMPWPGLFKCYWSRNVGWATTQFPVFSGKVLLSGGQKAIFSNMWSYKLASLPGLSGRSNFKVTKALCCSLIARQPAHQVSCPNKAIGFTSRVISSASVTLSSSCWVR